MSARASVVRDARGVGLLVVVTFSLVALFVAAWFPWREHESGLDALEHKTRNQAVLVAYTIAPAVEFGDASMIGEVFRGAARDGDFLGVEARARDGATIATLGDVRRPGMQTEVPITTPGGEVGILRLVMSTARVDAESRTQFLVSGGIGFMILLLGIGVGVGVTQATRRITALRDDNLRASTAAEEQRVKAQFLANMSHEIRTPLNGVIGLADVLSRRQLDPQANALVGSIVRSARNLLGLINDVLDLSRLESGRLEIERAPFDPEVSACVCCETLMPAARARGLELVLDVGASVPATAEGDRLRYEQVLINLAGNAVKFTTRGRVVVTLRWQAGTLVTAVRDTGVGIAKDKIETIFEAFAQADASTTRQFGGTGLGLTISRELVRRMGGDIRVESEEGRGSTFSFDLEAPAIDPAPAPELTRPPSLVLIVSDEPEVGPLLEERARERGIEVALCPRELAGVAIDALAAREGWALPIVLWDVAGGPPQHGLRDRISAAVGAARAHLILHASAVDPSHDDLLASDVLPKPFTRAAFARTLDGVESASSRPAAPWAGRASGLKVLVAEDDATNRIVITSFLAELGISAEIVGTGRHAVEAVVDSGPWALVLMDCQMPEMDGYEATRRIRAFEKRTGAGRVPIVAVTAHASDEDRARAERAGMDGYVTKPLTFDTFRAAVRALLPGNVELSQPPIDVRAQLSIAFRRSADDGIAVIGAALSKNDLDAVRNEAHRLKGSCLAVGERDVARIAADLEASARAGDGSGSGRLTVELEMALADAVVRVSERGTQPSADQR